MVIVRRWTFLKVGQIASLLVASMLGFTCQAVRGFPTFAPCLEHVCAGGGGGGSVAIVCLVLIYLRGL